MTAPRKRWLLVCGRAPYGSTLPRDALDVALAAAAFDQPVSLLFIGDGLWQLLDGQQAAAIGQKDLHKQLGALPLYDIDQIFVDAAALVARGLATGDLALPAVALEPAQITALLGDHDLILGF